MKRYRLRVGDKITVITRDGYRLVTVRDVLHGGLSYGYSEHTAGPLRWGVCGVVERANEGVGWVRGHNTKRAKAFIVAAALRHS